MKALSRFSKPVKNLLILLLLGALVLSPRPVFGVVERARADRSLAAGDPGRAALEYRLAAERLPWKPSLWESAGEASLQLPDYSAAAVDFARADKHRVLSFTGHLHWGDAIFALGEPTRALAAWQGARHQLNLDDPAAGAALTSRLAKGFAALKDFDSERTAWSEYLTYTPDNPAALYRYGLLLAAATPAEALPYLVKAASLDPKLDGSVQQLRTSLNTAMLSSDSAYQLVVTGQALGAQDQWELAQLAFKRSVIENPAYAEVWAWLAEAEQHNGGDGKASIDHARRLNPSSALVQSLYGVYLQRQKEPVRALEAFQAAVVLEPANPAWQMALGRAYELTDDLVAALEHYQRATELAPNDTSTWRALAEFSLRDGVDVSGIGIPAVLKLVKLAPDDWRSYDLWGQLDLETGDTLSAEDLLNRAVKLDPTQAAPMLHLGVLYLQINDRVNAYTHLVVARSLDPDGPSGWQANRLLEQFFP